MVKDNPQDILGASLKELTNEQKRSYGVSYGISVQKVNSGKFREVGIKEGFIILTLNNAPVRSITDVRRRVTQAQSSRNDKALVVKGFYPNGRMKYYVIDLS